MYLGSDILSWWHKRLLLWKPSYWRCLWVSYVCVWVCKYFIHTYINSSVFVIHHTVVCLPTGPWPHPKRVFHGVRASVSFNLQHPLFSLRSSRSCLHLLPRLYTTSILPSIFPSITCFRRQFVCVCLYILFKKICRLTFLETEVSVINYTN